MLVSVSTAWSQYDPNTRTPWLHPTFEDDLKYYLFPNLPSSSGMEYLLHTNWNSNRNLLTYYFAFGNNHFDYPDARPVSYSTSHGSVKHFSIGGQEALGITPANEDNTYQCVAFIKAVSNLFGTRTTSDWKRGNKVSSNTAKYTIVATFNGFNNSYLGHVGIFMGTYPGGIVLVDQNYLSNGAIAQHRIPWGTAGVFPYGAHGNNYYEVRAPKYKGGWLQDWIPNQ